MISLRSRLLAWLLPATFLVAAMASVGSLWGAAISLADLLDEQLRYVAEHVNVDGAGMTVDRRNEPLRHLSDEHADDVRTEVWEGDRLAYASGPALRLPAPGPPGLHDVVSGGQEWHTFVVRRDGTAIRVAQAKDARWEALARVAVNLLWPILALLPVLGICLWFGIGYGLQPLRQIAAELTRREAHSLAPVQPRPLPEEVRPLVDALNDMLQRLDHAFEAQSEFIADASHELRTPAMALGIHVELARNAPSEDVRDDALRQVHKGVQRLDRLAQQLLTLARVASGAHACVRERLDLAAACREAVVEGLLQADQKDQELGLDVRGRCEVLGDPVKLQVLIRNLLDNAIRYSPPRSRIDLAVRREPGGVALEIQDNGPGIPIDERAKVLQRFYRGGDRQQIGSGLGLAIVQRIAHEHGAVLTLSDRSGVRGLRADLFFADAGEAMRAAG